MIHADKVTRRTAMGAMMAASGAMAVGGSATADTSVKLKGNVNHSICRWCYDKMDLAELCQKAAALGITGMDLLGPDEWPVAKENGLQCVMAWGPGKSGRGWNDLRMHDKLIAASEELMPKVAEAGIPNMVVFSGNRGRIDDTEGLANCATGLKRILPQAEKLGVTLTMELLNSKRDHKKYQCDHTAWGVELCKQLGSDRFKLLYDIYHMQIMEGDVIATIQENIDCIAHIHTGGVPGRNEIDETQELHYPRIIQAIVDTGFKGYIAQEFVPKRDPMTSLQQAITLCDV